MALRESLSCILGDARLRCAGSILAGAALLVWPAAWNGYPIQFVDSMFYEMQALDLKAPWDKPAAYGLFLWLFYLGISLWLPTVVQGVILSALLWLVQRVALGSATAVRHLLLLALLSAVTAAPWFTATLMPDAFTPMVLLCVYLLGFGQGRLARWEAVAVGAVCVLAVATHYAHLFVALGGLAAVLVLRRQWRPLAAVALPVGLAMGFWLGYNIVAYGRPALSVYGPVFLLARLQEDGPATQTMRAHCPAAGWHLCRHIDRMPGLSDWFLWSLDSPMNIYRDGNFIEQLPSCTPRRTDFGGGNFLAEAREIVALTLRERPLAVARAMLTNTLLQMTLIRVGDGLLPVDRCFLTAVLPRFPAAEQARFAGALQADETLEQRAEALVWPHLPVLALSIVGVAVLGWRRLAGRRGEAGDEQRLALVLCVLLALCGNAFATGGLSNPHDRYQSRVIWLLPLAAGLGWWPRLSRAMPAAALRQLERV